MRYLGVSERIDFLRKYYPGAAVFVMKNLGLQTELEHFIEKCKACEDNWRDYSYYIFGYWLPYIQK